MKTLYKISLIYCGYLSIVSLLSLLSHDIINGLNIISFITPFPLTDGNMFGDMFAFITGLLIPTIGLLGFLVFILSTKKYLIGLYILLILTFLYSCDYIFLLVTVDSLFDNQILLLITQILMGLLSLLAIFTFIKIKRTYNYKHKQP